MVSVLILTKNEEQDLPGCLETLHWSDDVHVLDSFSTDRTVEIAKAFGASVVQRTFDNWSSHQNWAIGHLPFKHPWIFYLDADERVSPALKDSIVHAVSSETDNVAFRTQRRDFFMGTWLKHVQTSAFYLRLFKKGRMRYERLVNPVSIPDGPVGELSGYLDHFPFSKGISHWMERHNHYSSLEARQILEGRKGKEPPRISQAIWGADFHIRRYHQKELFYRMPLRPLVKFVFLYIVRRGFLDGTAGFTYAVLQSIYEYLIVLKTRELLRSPPSDKAV